MKKLFLILAAAAFMVACTPKSQPVVEEPTDVDEVVMVEESEADVVETPAPAPAPTKPAVTKPAAPKAEPKAEPKEEPKPEPKEEPKPDEPKTNQVKGRR